MKKLLFLLGLLPMFVACDNVGEDDRYIEIGAVEVARNVLLEEFTGQLCTNCPDAHRVIEMLEAQYGEQLIVVSIHAGEGQFGIPYPYGLMQKEGDEYAKYWGIYSYPAGVVDRIGPVLDYGDFATAVRNEIGKETPVELVLKADVNDAGNKINVLTTLVSPTAVSGSLQLWVVESGIVAYQVDHGVDRMDYVHNNVFRACVNGQWGQSVPLGANDLKYVENSVTIDPEWNLDNVRIVGFYYNAGGVLQVERCALNEEPMDD